MSPELVTYSPAAIKAALDAGDIDALMSLNRARFGGFTMLEGDGADAGTTDGADAGDAGTDDDDAGDDEPGDEDTTDPKVKRANKQAANYRTQLRAQETKTAELEQKLNESTSLLDKLKAAFGVDVSPEDDPAKQLEQITGETETLRQTVAEQAASLLVHNLAATNGANPTALLDSKSFMASLAKLDASQPDHDVKVAAAIKDAVAMNAAFKAGPVQARGGSELDPTQREQQDKRPKGLAGAVAKKLGG